MSNGAIQVGGIIKSRDLTLIGVMSAPDRPGIGAAIFRALGEADLNAQFIVQCIDLRERSHVLFCVAEEDAAAVMRQIMPVAESLAAEEVSEQPGVALLSVFGPDFRERPGIAGAVFGALAVQHINILAISTSISTVSCVIADADMPQAIETLNQVFRLP